VERSLRVWWDMASVPQPHSPSDVHHYRATVAFLWIVTGASVAMPRLALAHAGAPIAPHDVWSAWTAHPLVIIPLALSAALYGRGASRLWKRAGRGHGVTVRQAVAALLALATMVVALVSPIDALGETLFSAHMTQHMLLVVVAAPLVVASAPVVPALWGLPESWRLGITRWWARRTMPRLAFHHVTNPLAAWCAHALALVVWHIPAAYEAALRSEGVHAIEHASFLITAMLFWWAALQPSGRRRLGHGVAVVYLFLMAVLTGGVGALITFAGKAWYPAHAPGAALWGLTPLEDQQLAGLIMWIPGGIAYAVVALLLLLGWLAAAERGTLRHRDLADA
jgi:putative membrane protein